MAKADLTDRVDIARQDSASIDIFFEVREKDDLKEFSSPQTLRVH
jgi:hypothetical protein